MSGPVLATVSILFLLLLLALHIHVAVALAITGFLGMWLLKGSLPVAMGVLITTPYSTVAQYTLAVVPLYILMGVWIGAAGFAERAYHAAHIWIGRVRGSLAIATVIANALFGAACGSSTAACAVFTKVSLPEMSKHGYNKGFAAATIASAGALAMLIPPSGLMIIYGILAEQSIGDLFIAGIAPGLLLALFFSVTVLIQVRLKPSLLGHSSVAAENHRITWAERFSALWSVWGIILLIVAVLGGIYSGLFTPIEAGAVGAALALLLSLSVGRLKPVQFWASLKEAGRTTAMVFFILIGAVVYSKFLALSGLPEQVIGWVGAQNLPPLGIVLAAVVVYIILGTLIDAISMMTITLPVIIPILSGLGQDLIWFGIVAIVAMELGLITPPFGIDIFTVKAAAGGEVSLSEIFSASIPFYFAFVLVLALIIAIPALVIWL